jgi:phytoene synthase
MTGAETTRAETSNDLAAIVRRHDFDRYFGALFAPPAGRERLILLYAFNHELARAREAASSGPMALIRLQWWREIVEGAVRAHPVAQSLAESLAAIDAADLLALIDAREAEAEGIETSADFHAYVRASAGGLARVAGRLLGVADPRGLAALEDLGTAYGIAGILRAAPALSAAGRSLLPQSGADRAGMIAEARRLLAATPPESGIPAALPSVLAARDLRRLERAPHAPHIGPRGLGDRLAVCRAAVRWPL